MWAEENSRDALFAALAAPRDLRHQRHAARGALLRRRRSAACAAATPTSSRTAYAPATPMGGELGAVRGRRQPALRRAGAQGPRHGGAARHRLERVQIVKGWVDADGTDRTSRSTTSRASPNGAGVDPATCAPTRRGRRRAVHRVERSRVRRRASAPSTTRACSRTRPAAGARASARRTASIRCRPTAPPRRPSPTRAFADCCLDESNDAFVSPIVQERAWTSPVWYRKEGIAAVTGGIDFGRGNNRDALDLTVRLAAAPPGIDLTTAPAAIEVRRRRHDLPRRPDVRRLSDRRRRIAHHPRRGEQGRSLRR